MDVEAEIIDLKLRVKDLEAATHPGRTTFDDHGQRCAHANLLTEICMRMETMQAAITGATVDVAQARAELTDAQSGTDQKFAALGIEIANLRSQTTRHLTSVQSEIQRRLDFLRCEMIDLDLRLDRLLHKDGA
ncbi:hypothetical protein ABT294_13480 [Nonomuraea sp. NPDC000554]|uniref:hypothetical protein n=1 Tax=Nonomuraea sp. NPDC000554 TaxID=3154259 RepID=UPI00332C61E1